MDVVQVTDLSGEVAGWGPDDGDCVLLVIVVVGDGVGCALWKTKIKFSYKLVEY